MSHFWCLLAAFNEFETADSYQRNVFTSGLSEGLIIFGAVGVTILLLFIGVVIFRKQILRRRHHRHNKSGQVLAVGSSHGSAVANHDKLHRNRRRVRRKRRRRNPTLAEVRGLPPNKHEHSMDPSAS